MSDDTQFNLAIHEIEEHLENVQYCLEHMQEPDTMRPKLLATEETLIDVLNILHFYNQEGK